MIAVDYDAADSKPTNKADFMSYFGSIQGPVWKDISFRCDRPDLAKFGKQKYTRRGEVPTGKDVKTYDIGNILFGCSNVTGVKGSLYLNYEVELSTPHVNSEIPSDYSAVLITENASKANPLFDAVVTNATSVIMEKVNESDFQINEPGEWLIDGTFGGTGLTVTAPVDSYNILSGDTVISTVSAPGKDGTSTYLMGSQIKLNCTRAPSVLRFLPPAGWTTLTKVMLKLLPWKYSLPSAF